MRSLFSSMFGRNDERNILRQPDCYSLNVRFLAKITRRALAAKLPLWVVKGPPGQHDIVASRDTAPYETACVPAINPWNERRRFWSGALHDNGLTALCVPLNLKPLACPAAA